MAPAGILPRALLAAFTGLAAASGAVIAAAPVNAPAARAAGESPPHPRRIVTLAPHITEMVFAAGAGQRIVGTVSSSDYPPQARTIPRVGNGIQLSIERIVGLRPDLIIAWKPSGAARALAPILKRLGIPIAYIAPRKLSDIPADILELGRRLGSEKQAQQAAGRLSRRISALSARYAARKSVSAFIEVGSEPLYTLGDDPLTNDALHTCGGTNVFARARLPAPQVNAESVLAARPDAVIIPTTNAGRLASRARYWKELNLPAALSQHVYGMDPDAFFRPGPRLIDATAALCKDLDDTR